MIFSLEETIASMLISIDSAAGNPGWIDYKMRSLDAFRLINFIRPIDLVR